VTRPVYCIEVLPKSVTGRSAQGTWRGTTYGCSRQLEDAITALDRARKRGVTWGEIVERKTPPRGMHVNEWLPPFDERKAGFR
jgi:hypothetical protein